MILNQNVAGNLHLVRVRVGRMRHLSHDSRIGRVGRIDDAERHRRSAEMRYIDVSTILEQLHAVAMAIEIMVADQTNVPTFASVLDISDVHGSSARERFTAIKASRLELIYFP